MRSRSSFPKPVDQQKGSADPHSSFHAVYGAFHRLQCMGTCSVPVHELLKDPRFHNVRRMYISISSLSCIQAGWERMCAFGPFSLGWDGAETKGKQSREAWLLRDTGTRSRRAASIATTFMRSLPGMAVLLPRPVRSARWRLNL